MRPQTVRMLWAGFAVALALLVFADFFVEHHGAGIGATAGFYAWFGFLACIVLVAAAKGLGLILKRPTGYYDS